MCSESSCNSIGSIGDHPVSLKKSINNKCSESFNTEGGSNSSPSHSLPNKKQPSKTTSSNSCNSRNILSSLNCFYTNATSLCNKFEEFSILAKDEKLMFISETWYSEDFSPCLDGYEMYSSNRTERVGGGVALYVNKDYNSYELHDPILCNKDIEQVWCAIAINGNVIFLGCFYRPPGHNDNDVKIVESIKSSLSESKYTGVLIYGDFNCPKIEWNSGQFTVCKLNDENCFENLFID
ncbi:unnamed protein product [Brachionus calyciflorus]|uniref:Endonuclease/exonuclease/phosphatase domain-containing protein n=1 Tax=Brachionus calyciflorus TaxID=104777 RepID=A0A814E0D7_9BILA|nr:unnamed protein product [Brachionus calyciflorus]